jgi:hypothetical protein
MRQANFIQSGVIAVGSYPVSWVATPNTRWGCRWGPIVHVASMLCLAFALLASTAPSLADDVPLHRNLAPFAQDLELAQMVVLGDSIWITGGNSRMPGGLARTWPVDHVRRVIKSTQSGTDDGMRAVNFAGGGSEVAVRLPAAQLFDGLPNRAPNRLSEFTFTADLPDDTLLARRTAVQPGSAGSYPFPSSTASWDHQEVLARVLWRRSPLTPFFAVRTWRGVLSQDHGTIAGAGAAGIAFSPVFALPPGAGNVEVTISTAPGHNETGSHLALLDTFVWIPGAAGFGFSSIAQAGYFTRNHLDPFVDPVHGRWTDAELIAYYSAMPTVPSRLLVQLGANHAPGETTGDPAYRTNIELVVDRHLSALAAAGEPHVRVALVAPYDTVWGGEPRTEHRAFQAAELHALAVTRGWGFLNLFRAVNDKHGDVLDWGPLLTTDLIHPNPAGADEFAMLTWQVIQASTCYANCDGSIVDPILNIEDFSCFINRFAAGDPYANCDGSVVEPILNVDDFICFINQFAAGCL